MVGAGGVQSEIASPTPFPQTPGMPRESAGLLLYRHKDGRLEFLLAHPGGPFWKNKEAGAWTIPKGELQAGEDALTAAKREFEEELGIQPVGAFESLGSIKQKSGKIVHAWAFAGDFDLARFKSNTFKIEYPPRSGKWAEFPEVDKIAFLTMEQAKENINPAQVPFLERLAESLSK